MSPIPANASAAMIFSFFVAVIITPWLMMKVAGRAPAHNHADEAHHGGMLGRIYSSVARPLLRTKSGSLLFLLLAAALSFGSLGALYTRTLRSSSCPSTTSPNCRL